MYLDTFYMHILLRSLHENEATEHGQAYFCSLSVCIYNPIKDNRVIFPDFKCNRNTVIYYIHFSLASFSVRYISKICSYCYL